MLRSSRTSFYLPVFLDLLLLFAEGSWEPASAQILPGGDPARQRPPQNAARVEKNSCHVEGKPVQCLPPFQDLALDAFVQASSTCGENKVQRLCRSDGTCRLCDASSREVNQRFTSDRLTDRGQLHRHQTRNNLLGSNQTCWASGLVRPGSSVNLTVSLGKRFEVYYISLRPCLTSGSMPDSIAVHKSSDFGRTWRAWHYFSVDCYRAFGLPTTDEHNSHITSANLQEVLCVALQPREGYAQHQRRTGQSPRRYRGISPFHQDSGNARWETSSDWVITFSTTLGRPASRPWSPALIDWMTMTDVRIDLIRFPPNSQESDYRAKRTVHRASTKPNRNQYHYGRNAFFPIYNPNPHRRSPRKTLSEFGDLKLPDLPGQVLPEARGNRTLDRSTAQSLADQDRPGRELNQEPDVLSDTEFFAFADLKIGGRCKCNGHASECLVGRDGRLRCACSHSTEGDDCERCQPGHMDRPWDRATTESANVCRKCDCNLHSEECRFSNDLFLVSNRVSGGVCENCQHHTAGRNCQHCSEGHYRDWSKPISHEQACLPCRCHPIGSLLRHDCDRRSGQCRCKQGVTGLGCDRCQDGYHQTRSQVNPCTKDISPQIVAMAHTPVDIHCVPCSSNKERIRMKKYCRKDIVLRAFFRSRELHGTMAKFGMHVTHLWRLNSQGVNTRRGIFWPAPITFDSKEEDWSAHGLADNDMDEQKLTGQEIPVWVRLTDLRCKCPEIELGISYMVVTEFESFLNRGRYELLFTTKTAVLPWRVSWRRRLSRLQRRENRGACERLRDTSKLYTADSITASARRRGFRQSRPWLPHVTFRQQHRPYGPTTAYGYRLAPTNQKQVKYNSNYYRQGHGRNIRRAGKT